MYYGLFAYSPIEGQFDSFGISRLVVSDSLWPHGLWPTRFLCPWNYPGKNIGVGSHSLLQGIFPTQALNLGLPHCRQILYHLSLIPFSFLFCFVHFNWGACFLVEVQVLFVYIRYKYFLSDMCFADIFSASVACLFILLTVSFAEQKF